MIGIFFDILEINIVAGGAIIFLCIFADRLRGRYGAGWMKLAWLLLAVRLLIPYNFSLPGTEIRLLNYAGFEQESLMGEKDFLLAGAEVHVDGMQAAMYTDGVQEADAGAGNMVGVQTESAGLSNTLGAQAESTGMGNTPGAQKVTGETAAMGDAQTVRVGNDSMMKDGSGRSPYFYTRILVTIWLVGVGIGFLHLAGSYLIVFHRYRKRLRPVTDAQLVKRICILQKRTIGHARLMVYQSGAVASPCLMGLLRPKLVLPTDGSRWKKTELELVIAHELCHYRKRDLWLKMLMAAVCRLHWFNPCVWLMKKQFFYDMELACDGSVLAGKDEEEREKYAKVMLMFAGNRKGTAAFSTSFGGSRKQMKARIDYMLDAGTKKKGRLSIVIAMLLVLLLGIVVSCGYKQESDGGMGETENNGTVGGDGLSEEDRLLQGDANPYTEGSETEDGSVTSDDIEVSPSGQDELDADYNYAYNHVVKGYQGDVYLSKKDGIYYLKDGQGEERLLYANAYEDARRMELDGKNLYFSGQAPEGKNSLETVYRMDLDTHEVVDALAGFELEQPDYLITNLSVYEGNLYVALGAASMRTGYALDENGDAVSQLDDGDPYFLYKEYNEYMEMEFASLNAVYDSEEYWELANERDQMYQAVIDVASCKKLLDGRQVVSRYKDESLRSVYLENEDGTYEYLCDTTGIPMLVTETGLYYNDISGEIWYADFETKQKEMFYRRTDRADREWSDLSLVTYDADYVYMIQNKHIGEDMQKRSVDECYLVRVPRADGEAQKVYRFPENVRMYGDNGWYRHCGVYGGWMYFDNRESFRLDPEVNGMQGINDGVPCEDAVEMKETIRAFATAYFTNDEETLRGLLSDDFEGNVELYEYPEQADKIKETYVGGEGIPSMNIDIGVRGYVYYEFTGLAEAEDNVVAYLSILMIKTPEGFRIQWYGLQL